MLTFIKKHKTVFKIGLLMLVVAFVAQFIWHTDVEVIGTYLKKMPFTFLGIIGLSFSAYICATIAWKLCLGDDEKKVGLGYLFLVRHVGEMLSVFNPTSIVAGEALKAHYLSERKIPKEVSISSILLSRVLIILSALLLMIISVLYLISGNISPENGWIIATIAVIITGIFGYLLARFLLHSKLYLHRSVRRLQERFGKKYITDDFCESLQEVNQTAHDFYHKNNKKFILAFVLSSVHWIFGAAEFYLILKVMDFDISVVNALAIEMGVILFKTIGAIVPGQIGVEEYANKVMLDAIGIASNEVWLVVSIMRRARQLFWAAIAALFYWMLGRKNSD